MAPAARAVPPDESLAPRDLDASGHARSTVGEHADWSTDLELVRRARAGSRAAIDGFVERMRCIPRILQVHNARAGQLLSADDLADAAQQVFARVWSKTAEFRGDASLESWVWPFCKHVFLSRLRERGRRAEPVPVATALEGRAAPAPDADAELALEPLDAGHVLAALRTLPEEEARAVELKQLEELTFEEIGARLSISPNTAKSRYYRGLAGLRERLKDLAPPVAGPERRNRRGSANSDAGR
jgi:RNA polymerase sigma-70 factor, ECF subfamily